MLDSATSPLTGITSPDPGDVSNSRNAPAGRENADKDGAFARVMRSQSASRHGEERRAGPAARDPGHSGKARPPDRRDVAADREARSDAEEAADAKSRTSTPQATSEPDRSATSDGGDGSKLPAYSTSIPQAISEPDRSVTSDGGDGSKLPAYRHASAHGLAAGLLVARSASAVEGPSSGPRPQAGAAANPNPVASPGEALIRVAGALLNATAADGDSSGATAANADQPEVQPSLGQRALAAARGATQARAKALAKTNASSSASGDGPPESSESRVAGLQADTLNAARLAVRGASADGASAPQAPVNEARPVSREAAPATPVAPAGPAISTQSGPGVASNLAPAPGADLAMQRAPTDPEFADELGARMQVMLRDGVHKAHIQLQPAELGRLQVTISTEGDQARVAFLADTSATRDVIEQSLPRLREMLEQNGLQLAQSDVGQRGGSEPDGSAMPRAPIFPAPPRTTGIGRATRLPALQAVVSTPISNPLHPAPSHRIHFRSTIGTGRRLCRRPPWAYRAVWNGATRRQEPDAKHRASA